MDTFRTSRCRTRKAGTWECSTVFAQKYTLEVRYVGTKGIHLPVQLAQSNRPNLIITISCRRIVRARPGDSSMALTTTADDIMPTRVCLLRTQCWIRCCNRSWASCPMARRSTTVCRRSFAATSPTACNSRPPGPGAILRQLDGRRLLNVSDAASSAGLPVLCCDWSTRLWIVAIA